ncbi:MAG: cysteine synthase A [Chromatiales bacterium]|jgi:cysteine synthase A
MEIRSSVLDCIGNTPLVRLAAASAATGCEILGKAEFMNPGGSIKDRAALGIVRAAEASGELRPGGTIVEGTAGNTGIGIAMVANALGYRTVIVMPDTQSKEKIDTLRAYGADLHLVPAVPYRNPENYVHVSQRLADQLATTDPAGAVWANQFDNTANRDFHAVTTGPEIWNQTEGKVDGFVCAVGTGGTLAGVASALRTRKPGVSIALSDPAGSGLYHYYANGEIRVEGNSITEGIGNGRITGNLQDVAIDHAFRIEDSESIPIVFRLLREEGLLLGGSSGVNVAGAIRLARELGPGHVIVTILCDSGLRYRGKLFNRDFLVSKGLDAPDWLQTIATP